MEHLLNGTRSSPINISRRNSRNFPESFGKWKTPAVSTFSPIYPGIPETASYKPWGPFLESPSNLPGPISLFCAKCFSTDKPKSSSS